MSWWGFLEMKVGLWVGEKCENERVRFKHKFLRVGGKFREGKMRDSELG